MFQGGKRGFTLIELMLSLSLMVILISGVIFSLGQSGKNWKKLVRGCEKMQAESIVLARICQEVRNSKGIDINSKADELILQIGDEKVKYLWRENKIGKKAGNNLSYLTDTNETDKIIFTYLDGKRVKISIGEYSLCASARNG